MRHFTQPIHKYGRTEAHKSSVTIKCHRASHSRDGQRA